MSSTRNFYNFLALVFDFSIRYIVQYRAPDFLRHYLLSLATSESNILDIGTGTGHAIEAIYHQRQFASIHGVDISAEMLRRCKRKFPDIHLHEGDVFSLPDDFSRWFHLIICMGAVEHIPDLPRFFVRCGDLLHDDGHLVFTYEPVIVYKKNQQDPHGHLKFFSNVPCYRHDPAEIAKHLNSAGLLVVDDREFVAYWGMVFHMVMAMKIKQPNKVLERDAAQSAAPLS
ncbi:MAG: hypothetical protein A4S17_09190 [Proteobacteria bacterium HN_bin10]|nr:MAG: hypothetical protein A4S17_09190 [Proteobacteria bacterium HN_bin10]